MYKLLLIITISTVGLGDTFCRMPTTSIVERKSLHLGSYSVEKDISNHENAANISSVEPADDMDKIVLEEAGKLDRLAGFKTNIEIVDTGTIASDPQKGITFSREQLRSIKERS